MHLSYFYQKLVKSPICPILYISYTNNILILNGLGEGTNMKKMTTFSVICIGLMAFSFAGHAGTVYKWTDSRGEIHYTQKPPKSGPYQTINQGGSTTSSTSPYGIRVEKETSKTDTNTNQSGSSNTGSADSSDTVKDTLAEGQEMRISNCNNAKKNLQIYTTHKRFKDKDGNVYRMDDDKRMGLIEESKQQISEFCD